MINNTGTPSVINSVICAHSSAKLPILRSKPNWERVAWQQSLSSLWIIPFKRTIFFPLSEEYCRSVLSTAYGSINAVSKRDERNPLKQYLTLLFPDPLGPQMMTESLSLMVKVLSITSQISLSASSRPTRFFGMWSPEHCHNTVRTALLKSRLSVAYELHAFGAMSPSIVAQGHGRRRGEEKKLRRNSVVSGNKPT